MITSLKNPRVAEALKLRKRGLREARKEFLVEGPQAIGEDFNIGNPRNTITVFELARMVLELTGRDVPIVYTESPCPDIEIRVPSLEKARQLLGYKPAYDLRRALKLTADWYRENLDFFDNQTERVYTASAGVKG